MTQQNTTLPDREALVESIKRRMRDGEMTKEQATAVLESYSQQAGTMPAQEPAAQPAPQPQQPTAPQPERGPLRSAYDFLNQGAAQFNRGLLGSAETALNLGTGGVAEPIAGLSGLAALPFGADAATGIVEGVREGMTYNPRSQPGQQMQESMAGVLAPVGRGVEAVERFAGDIGYEGVGPIPGGGAAGGAVASAVPAAILEIAGLKGTRQAKKAALANAVAEAGPDILTPEARQVLMRQGFTESELANMAVQDPQQLERLARFQRLGIQPTRGDITQRLTEQKPEAELFQSAEDASGAGMRQLRRGQSEQLRRTVDDMIDETGVRADVGQSIKDALKSRRTLLKDEVRSAYDALAQAQGTTDIPIMIGDVRQIPEIPQGADLRTIQRADSSKFQALQDLLSEFGLDDNAESLARLEREGVAPQHLNISNFEEFRKALNSLDQSDQTGNLGRVIGPIKRELDRQVDAMTETLELEGAPDVSALAKNARQNNIAYRTEFDPKSLTSKLIEDKPRSRIPQVETSQVYTQVAANRTPIEQVDRLYQSLTDEGAKGRRAISDLQSQMMFDLLDSAFTGVTRKVDGQAMLSGPALSKRFDALEDKARIIFQDNPQALNQLRDVVRAAEDVTPQNIAVPKGSAGFLMDSMQRLGMAQALSAVPGGQLAINGLSELSARSQNRTALRRALNADPDLKRTANVLATNYPSLAATLGIGFLVGQDEQNDDTDQNQ